MRKPHIRVCIVSICIYLFQTWAVPTFLQSIVKKPLKFKNFEVLAGLIYLKTNNRKLLCILYITIDGKNIQEIVILEAHSILAYLGTIKTLTYFRDHVWWKDMMLDTKMFCQSCITCWWSKPSNHKPYGLLNLLSVPGVLWESIGVNFVGLLSKSKNRNRTFNCIAVIICLLTGILHLVPSRINYNTRQMAELIFEEVYIQTPWTA